MKKILENVLTVVGGCVLIVGFLSACEGKQEVQEVKPKVVKVASEPKKIEAYEDKFVVDTFKITEVNDKGEISGDLVTSTAKNQEWSTAEGIFLDSASQEDFSTDLRTLKVGDMIEVVYYTKEYKESIWDNLLDVKKVN